MSIGSTTRYWLERGPGWRRALVRMADFDTDTPRPLRRGEGTIPAPPRG